MCSADALACTAAGFMDELKNLSHQKLEALQEKYEYTSRIFPDSDSLLALAEVYLALGMVTRARRTVSDFIEKKGDTSRAKLILAKAHLICWDAAAAEKDLKKALSLDRRNKQALELLIHIYKSSGRTAEAFRVALSPGTEEPWRRIESAGKAEEPPCLKPDKKSRSRAGVFATDTMLNLYVSQGLYKDALGIVEVLCETDPDNPVYKSKREEIMALLSR